MQSLLDSTSTTDPTDVVARYAPLMAGFSAATAVLVRLAARRGASPGGPLELTETALAAFYVTRVIAKEKVGAVVRHPFVEPHPDADPADPHGEAKQPTGDGLRRSIGELVTCTRCLGPWAGAALTVGQAFAPRSAPLVTRILALAGANSLLQASQTLLAESANRQART